jgi:hypothetical protein
MSASVPSLVKLCVDHLPRSKFFDSDDVAAILEKLESMPQNYVKLEGRFKLTAHQYPIFRYPLELDDEHNAAVSRFPDRYARTELCDPPVFSMDDAWCRLRWDSRFEPEFWVEFSFSLQDPQRCQLRGRGVPHTHTLTNYNEDHKYCTWRFDDCNQLDFWCQITIKND